MLELAKLADPRVLGAGEAGHREEHLKGADQSLVFMVRLPRVKLKCGSKIGITCECMEAQNTD